MVAAQDSLSLLLLLWILGTMAFAGIVNWSVTGRNILPMLPAVAILVALRLEARRPSGGRLCRRRGCPSRSPLALRWLLHAPTRDWPHHQDRPQRRSR